jgi:hypothetical protein
MADEPRYGDFGGKASRFAPNEAWVLDEGLGQWREINSVSHANEVHELSKAEFEADFPDAPPLPPEAFKEPRG